MKKKATDHMKKSDRKSVEEERVKEEKLAKAEASKGTAGMMRAAETTEIMEAVEMAKTVKTKEQDGSSTAGAVLENGDEQTAEMEKTVKAKEQDDSSTVGTVLENDDEQTAEMAKTVKTKEQAGSSTTGVTLENDGKWTAEMAKTVKTKEQDDNSATGTVFKDSDEQTAEMAKTVKAKEQDDSSAAGMIFKDGGQTVKSEKSEFVWDIESIRGKRNQGTKDMDASKPQESGDKMREWKRGDKNTVSSGNAEFENESNEPGDTRGRTLEGSGSKSGKSRAGGKKDLNTGNAAGQPVVNVWGRGIRETQGFMKQEVRIPEQKEHKDQKERNSQDRASGHSQGLGGRKAEKEKSYANINNMWIIRIAVIISGEDRETVEEISEMVSDIGAYFNAHSGDFSKRGVSYRNDSGVLLWVGLADCLLRRGFVCELDEKWDKNDFLAGVRQIHGFGTYLIPLKEKWLNENGDVFTWCKALDGQWRKMKICLSALDVGGSYLIFPVSMEGYEKLTRLADQIGRRVVSAAEIWKEREAGLVRIRNLGIPEF